MAPNTKEGEKPDNRIFVPCARSYLFLSMFILIFCLTSVELGLVSQQIHRYGRNAENYASLEYKNTLGLNLAACLISLLLCLGHNWLPLAGTMFFSLVCAVFFGVVGGVFRVTTPFRGTHCGRGPEWYPDNWRPYYKECSRIVTMEAFAWSLWALYIILLVGTFLYMFNITLRHIPGRYYQSHSRAVSTLV